MTEPVIPLDAYLALHRGARYCANCGHPNIDDDTGLCADPICNRPPPTLLGSLCIVRGCLNPKDGRNLCRHHDDGEA